MVLLQKPARHTDIDKSLKTNQRTYTTTDQSACCVFCFSSNKYTLNRNEKQENYNGNRSHKAHFFPRYGENKVVLRL